MPTCQNVEVVNEWACVTESKLQENVGASPSRESVQT